MPAASNAIEFQGKGNKLSMSDHAVDVAADCYKFTLNWIGNHTLSFVAFLVFLGWYAYVNVGNRVRRKARKQAYGERRTSARSGGGGKGRSDGNREPRP